MNAASENELKCLDLITFNKLMRLMDKLSYLEDNKEAHVTLLSAVCYMCIKLLKMPNATLKVIAMEGFLKYIPRRDLEEEFTKRLLDYKFIETAFCVNSHEEVIKKSRDILIFLNNRNALTKTLFDNIWLCCTSKVNAEISNSMFELLKNIMPYLSMNCLLLVAEKIKLLKPEEFTGQILKFIGDFAESAFKMMKAKGIELWDPQLLWNLIFEKKLATVLQELSLEIFSNILNANPDYKPEFYQLAGINFAENVNIDLTINFLLKTNFTNNLSKPKFLEEFALNNNLLKCCINSCMEFHQKIKTQIGGNNTSPNSSIVRVQSITVPETNLSFLNHCRIYLEFLHCLATSSEKLMINDADSAIIWNLYYKDPIIPEESIILWEILRKETPEKCIGFFPNMAAVKGFFKKFFENSELFDLINSNIHCFDCFKKYFELINFENMPKQFHSAKIPKKIDELTGLKILWDFSIKCIDQNVQKSASSFLIELFYKFIHDEKTDVVGIIKQFFIKILNEKYPNSTEFKSAINLIYKFITKYFSWILEL